MAPFTPTSPPSVSSLHQFLPHAFIFASCSTCDFVADQLAGLDLADAAEKAAELLLGHVLGQVVDDEVGLAVVVGAAGLHGRRATAVVARWPVGCGRVRPIRHLRLHVTDYLWRGNAGKTRGTRWRRSYYRRPMLKLKHHF